MKRRRRKPNEIEGAADHDSLVADREPESEPDPGRDYVARLQTGLGNAAFARLVGNRREAGDAPVLPGAGGAPGLSRLSLMRSLPRAGAVQRAPAPAIQRAPGPPAEAPAVPRAEDIVKTRFPHLAEAMKPEHYKAIQEAIAWRLRREKLNQQIIDFDRREREKQEREGWAAPGSNSYKFTSEYQDNLRRLQNKAEDAPDVTFIELDTSTLIDRAILAPQEWNIRAEEDFRKRWVVGLASKPTILTLIGDFPVEEGFKGPFWNGVPLPTEGGLITWDKLLDLPGAITDYYEQVMNSPMARAAKEYLAKLQGAWNKAEFEYQSERERKGEFPIVSRITEFFSSEIDFKAAEKFLPPGKSFKDMDPWEIMQFLGSLDENQLDRVKRVLISSDDYLKIYEHLLKVDTAVALRQYEAALIAMPMVADEIEEFYRKTVTYGQRVNAAASSIVTTLQYVRAGCNIVLTVGGGVMGKAYGLIGISAGSAAGAATGTFTQETAMQLAQGKFDPGSILFKTGKDAAMTFIGSMIGGALGSKFASLLGPRLATVIPNEAVRQFVVARVADVGAGLLTTPIDITVTGMIEGDWPKSVDDLMDKVAKNTITSVIVGGAVDVVTGVPNLKGKSWETMTETDIAGMKQLGEGTAKPGETRTTTEETPGGAKPDEAKTTTDTTGDPTGAGKAAIDTAQAKTGQTTPADVQTGTTAGGQAGPRSRVVSDSAEVVSIDRTKPISASGFKGSTAGRPKYGVFDAKIKLPNGQEVDAVVKILKPNSGNVDADFFAREVAGAKAAAETGFGPEFYGEVPMGKDWAFAMGKVEGGFTQNYAEAGSPGYAKAQAETEAAINALTPQTGQDVRNYGDALWKQGYAVTGDTQGLVGSDGRWRPIDFSGVKKVPSDPVEAAVMEAKHKAEIEGEASLYDKQLAKRDAAKSGNPPP
jgi:hypothetical protein